MNRHSFTYEQFCNVVGKNVVIEELRFQSGKRKVRCLHSYRCKDLGGCSNKYVLKRIAKAVEKSKEE